ncbi:MAG: adenylate/guanylate cyclase domain-containing protein [Chloroflexota bacterium]|nr:adenylate/guanylate cyclase domain-containing protein [Chloroflexota bacterium]
MAEPRVQYAKTQDGVSIALWTMGQGVPFIQIPSPPSAASQGLWQVGSVRRGFERQAETRLFVRFDHRGFGHSQRDVGQFSIDAWLLDLEAVVDHLELERFILFGMRQSATTAIAYAARHPERVSHLVIWNGSPRNRDLIDVQRATAMLAVADADWELYSEIRAYDTLRWSGGEETRRLAAALREGTSAAALHAEMQASLEIDVSNVVSQVRAPSLVLYGGDRSELPGVNVTRQLAASLPHAQFAVIRGHPYMGDEGDDFFHALDDFVGQQPGEPDAAPSAMAVILFTDIVDSTALTERLGDSVFRTASRALDEGMRAAMREAGGTAVEGKVLGDGVMGVFASASQAIAAARRCIELSAESELQLHVGLHAGDVTHEAGNVYGGAVNIASRICGLSAPGEILVSATIRELARTSAGVTFADRGEHALKGIADAVRVYAVRGVP